ncbi:MAG: DUF3380 domain-containing protein [Ignavibacteriales bacterium]|nr:DUF3380 domain-containing protein [Ignavibacteriales bacterium]
MRSVERLIERMAKSFEALRVLFRRVEFDRGRSARYERAASRLGVEPAAIAALAAVESSGEPINDDGTPRGLFEPHVFRRYTRGAFDKSHPRLSRATWSRSNYVGGRAEWTRFLEAYELDADAAIRSYSFGRWQIMGFNYRRAGYDTPRSFFDAMVVGDPFVDLEAFVSFVESDPSLVRALRRKDWRDVARRYNGKGQVLFYSRALSRAYRNIRKEER